MVFPRVSPFFTRNRVGNTSTLNFFGSCSFRSQLTLPTSTCPAISDATASRVGDKARQWWHQGAQKSTSTGTVEVSRISEKLSSFIAIGLDIISSPDIAFPFHYPHARNLTFLRIGLAPCQIFGTSYSVLFPSSSSSILICLRSFSSSVPYMLHRPSHEYCRVS